MTHLTSASTRSQARLLSEPPFLRPRFRLSEVFRGKMQRACTRQCEYECSKPGRAFGFAIPSKSVF